MINMKRYAGGKSPYELFSEAVDRKDKNGADTIELNAMKHKIEIADIMSELWINESWER